MWYRNNEHSIRVWEYGTNHLIENAGNKSWLARKSQENGTRAVLSERLLTRCDDGLKRISTHEFEEPNERKEVW